LGPRDNLTIVKGLNRRTAGNRTLNIRSSRR